MASDATSVTDFIRSRDVPIPRRLGRGSWCHADFDIFSIFGGNWLTGRVEWANGGFVVVEEAHA